VNFIHINSAEYNIKRNVWILFNLYK